MNSSTFKEKKSKWKTMNNKNKQAKMNNEPPAVLNKNKNEKQWITNMYEWTPGHRLLLKYTDGKLANYVKIAMRVKLTLK